MITQTTKNSLITTLAILIFCQSSLVALADSPQFNIHTPYTHTQVENRDYYLLDIKNETKNTAYNDPINADAGDILIFSVYYHNGTNNTVANNTRIRVNIPSYENSNQIVSTAYLSADNAYEISETGTVNLSSPQKLEFIPGSVKWYPDRKNPNYDSPTTLPSGQSGDEIISNRINLGNVNACWEYAGFVNFKVRVSGPAPVIVQPVAVRAVTGSNNIFIQIAVALIAGLSGIIIAYFLLQNQNIFAKMKLSAYALKEKAFGKSA